MCHKSSEGIKIWRAILGLLLMAELATLSFTVALDECINLNHGLWFLIFHGIVEVAFAIDFVLNFLTVPQTMRNPKPKRLVIEYLKSNFIFDLIALLSSIFYVIPGDSFFIWGYRLKLFRSFRLSYVRESYRSIIYALTDHNPKI